VKTSKPGIRSMTIEPGQGGFTSQVRRSGGRGEYMEPEMPTIHPSVQHLQAHVAKVFGGGKKTGGGAPTPAMPSKTQGAIASKMLNS
jgi:hypothetical protein